MFLHLIFARTFYESHGSIFSPFVAKFLQQRKDQKKSFKRLLVDKTPSYGVFKTVNMCLNLSELKPKSKLFVTSYTILI